MISADISCNQDLRVRPIQAKMRLTIVSFIECVSVAVVELPEKMCPNKGATQSSVLT